MLTVALDYFGSALIVTSDDPAVLALCIEQSPAWTFEYTWEDPQTIALWIAGEIPGREQIARWRAEIEKCIGLRQEANADG